MMGMIKKKETRANGFDPNAPKPISHQYRIEVIYV